MSADYESLWAVLKERERNAITLVQDKIELEYIYKLTRDCKSYLEIGSAEGNTLYVLGQDMEKIAYVDFGEVHTEQARNQALNLLGNPNVMAFLGNSHHHQTIMKSYETGMYDAVLIDAGHKYADVIADATAYGWQARKYIIFHDIAIEEVRVAFEWYCQQQQFGPEQISSFMVPNSPYGYGVVKLT